MRPIFTNCIKYPTREEIGNKNIVAYMDFYMYELVKPRVLNHLKPNKIYYSRYVSDLIQDVIKADPIYLLNKAGEPITYQVV